MDPQLAQLTAEVAQLKAQLAAHQAAPAGQAHPTLQQWLEDVFEKMLTCVLRGTNPR